MDTGLTSLTKTFAKIRTFGGLFPKFKTNARPHQPVMVFCHREKHSPGTLKFNWRAPCSAMLLGFS